KRSRELTYRNPGRDFPAFERRPAVVDLRFEPFPEVDREHWADYVERASAVARRNSEIKDSQVEFEAVHVSKVLVTSEGTRVVQCQVLWSLECYLWLLSSRGDAIPWNLKYIVADPAELPDLERFQREIRGT